MSYLACRIPTDLELGWGCIFGGVILALHQTALASTIVDAVKDALKGAADLIGRVVTGVANRLGQILTGAAGLIG